MGKKKCWFTYVKRFFLPESKPKPEEKPKKRTWLLEMFKFGQYPAIEAPQSQTTTINEANEEQRKRAIAVAVATAAAADAAIAAANAAAQVVRLTNVPYQLERRNQYFAAVKIQSAYRGHLAKKALSALKGIVKLQAVVRGELVRKNVIKRLAAMSLFSRPKPRVRKERVITLLDYLNHGEKRHSFSPEEESLEAFYLRKQEAFAKREHMKQYSYSHRETRSEQSLQEALTRKENRNSSRFDRCVELKVYEHGEKERPKSLPHSRTVAVGHISELTELKLTASGKQDMIEELNSPFSLPRRSFSHTKQRSIGDDTSLPNSPVFPAYMAATESAKAKSRSMSMPKQRLMLCDTYSGHNSPHKLRLSTWSSLNGEMINSGKRNSVSQINQLNH